MPKIAEVRYTGSMRSHTRRGPSGEQYRLYNTPHTDDKWEPVYEVVDAHAFEDADVLDFRWTGMGKVLSELDGPASETEAMLEQLGYRAKRRIAKRLGLEFDGNPKEAQLDEALEPELDDLQEAMKQ